MPIKTLLLPVGESDTGDALFDWAFGTAKRFDAHLDVLHVRADPDAMMPYATLGLSPGMRSSVREAAESKAHEVEKNLQRLFERACERHRVQKAARGSAVGKPSAAFIAADGRQEVVVAQHGRLTDLIVVPLPGKSTPPRTVDAALRDSGSPVLMVPRKVGKTVGENIVVGWNGSKEAAQAVSAARPCMREAKSVTILTTEKRQARRPNGDDVVIYLACHGIEAKVQIFDARGRSVPETLLGEAHQAGADLLVVGSYSRTRLREVMMGGVTRYLMAEADLPIFCVH
ncbi:MAG: universal stress protein [Gammaproteobacteria bacterium]|nr:universal stress protein [Gammaproteobacteria bacterium]